MQVSAGEGYISGIGSRNAKSTVRFPVLSVDSPACNGYNQ